jgi:hypothetical protein
VHQCTLSDHRPFIKPSRSEEGGFVNPELPRPQLPGLKDHVPWSELPGPAPPPIDCPEFANIPREWHDRQQFVNWRFVADDKAGWTKRPCHHALYDADPLKFRWSGATPEWGPLGRDTWRTFGVAAAWCHITERLGLVGLGFVFTEDDPYVFIDFDKVIDRATGLIKDPRVEGWLRELDSYTEVSPSGVGLHVFLRGKKPPGGNKNKQASVEVYDRDRFTTLTGVPYRDFPLVINERQEVLERLYAVWFPRREVAGLPNRGRPPAAGLASLVPATFSADQAERSSAQGDVFDRILRSKGREKFERLWAGDTSDHGDDHSAADLALCGILYRHLGGNPAAIDAMFRESGLYRPKWDERRGAMTYGERTIERAMCGIEVCYDDTPKAPDGLQVIFPASAVAPPLPPRALEPLPRPTGPPAQPGPSSPPDWGNFLSRPAAVVAGDGAAVAEDYRTNHKGIPLCPNPRVRLLWPNGPGSDPRVAEFYCKQPGCRACGARIKLDWKACVPRNIAKDEADGFFANNPNAAFVVVDFGVLWDRNTQLSRMLDGRYVVVEGRDANGRAVVTVFALVANVTQIRAPWVARVVSREQFLAEYNAAVDHADRGDGTIHSGRRWPRKDTPARLPLNMFRVVGGLPQNWPENQEVFERRTGTRVVAEHVRPDEADDIQAKFRVAGRKHLWMLPALVVRYYYELLKFGVDETYDEWLNGRDRGVTIVFPPPARGFDTAAWVAAAAN